jgi:hypothetical protein
VGHTVSEITEQAVDELDEIVTLVGSHIDEIFKNLIVALGMKLSLDGRNALGLHLLQANGVPDDP